MANTFTQIHIHAIFAVQNRMSLISKSWEEQLYKYITGIVQKNNHKMICINGIPDHIHVLFGMRPSQSISDLLQDIKGSSSFWINNNNFVKGKFSWQEGYGAFSYSKSQLSKVATYIENQKAHHSKETFLQEYKKILDDFEIEYDERYIFKEIV
jgi:putative transposase